MWIVLHRMPRPLATVWPGRPLLAAADAIAWPAVWMAMISQWGSQTGLLGQVSVVLALLLAVRGVRIALWHNERYRFISMAVWRVVWRLLLLGAVMKVAILVMQ